MKNTPQTTAPTPTSVAHYTANVTDKIVARNATKGAVVVPLLLFFVVACSLPVKETPESPQTNPLTKPLHEPTLSEEISLLRASVARSRALFSGDRIQPAAESGEHVESTVHTETLDGLVDRPFYPGEKTVEEHSRWPRANIPASVGGTLAEKRKDLLSLDAVNLPLNVLLYSLAEEAQLELSLEGLHQQPITLRVEDKPIAEILVSVAQQVPFRWELDKYHLRIAPDSPYIKTYSVNYLNMTRHMKGRVGLATQVGSINLSQDNQGGGGFSNSSQSLIENESHHAFWESLEEGMSSLFDSVNNAPVNISINRDASLVTVRAKHKQHIDIENYLSEIERSTQRQVLIEATVVEINLSEKFSAGVDWRMLGQGSSSVSAAQVFHGKPDVQSASIEKLTTPTALLSAIYQSNTLGKITTTLNLLNQFGDVKILSRPQIIAINNQSAVLKVVDNRVYFTMKVQRQSRDGEDELSTETEIHTVPVGLVMSVTPFIAEDNSVVLNVRPTVSRILGFVNDPNPELAIAQVQNGVPEIQVREMESVLKVGSGQIAMIGGLMQEQQSSDQVGVPLLDRLPLVGSLFRQQERRSGTTELLVFLQPTVLQSDALGRAQ